MYTLGPEEKASVVMAYTQAGLIRGELVTMQNTRGHFLAPQTALLNIFICTRLNHFKPLGGD